MVPNLSRQSHSALDPCFVEFRQTQYKFYFHKKIRMCNEIILNDDDAHAYDRNATKNNLSMTKLIK